MTFEILWINHIYSFKTFVSKLKVHVKIIARQVLKLIHVIDLEHESKKSLTNFEWSVFFNEWKNINEIKLVKRNYENIIFHKYSTQTAITLLVHVYLPWWLSANHDLCQLADCCLLSDDHRKSLLIAEVFFFLEQVKMCCPFQLLLLTNLDMSLLVIVWTITLHKREQNIMLNQKRPMLGKSIYDGKQFISKIKYNCILECLNV